MATEFFVVTALPHSCGVAAPFHVSLFFSPKLSPDGRSSVLSDWKVFPHWATVLRNEVKIELFDQNGPIDAELVLDPVEDKVWDAAFPPDTPVRTNEVPSWEQRHWRSFAAKHVHDISKAMHLSSVYADPTSPPLPDDHPITAQLMEVAGKYYRPTGDRDERRVYDESLVTKDLDGLIESRESLATIEKIVAAEDSWIRKLGYELHRVRRFYERPESQGEYRERPDRDVESTLLEPQPPEFHERCGMAGDHPALLRALGLAVDLRVADPQRLRTSEWLSARVFVAGDLSFGRLTRVGCRARGDDLVTLAGTSDWADGALRLGDEKTFSVLELDTDGSAIKNERFLWTIPRLVEIQADDAPVNAAAPALRASGLTVSRTSQAVQIQGRLDRQKDIEKSFTTGDPELLLTEDVARGVRVEVWDDQVKKWFSLHQRRTDVDVVGHGQVLDDRLEEGFIQGSPAHETPGVADSPVHVHEALFGWEGWSLSAERPGQRVRHEPRDMADPDSQPQEIVEPTPAAPDLDRITHPIVIRNEAAPGTLPRLRFGRSYAFRAWAVDLAGNSQDHELNPQPLPPVDIAAAITALRPDPGIMDAVAGVATGLRAATRTSLENRRLTQARPVEGASADQLLRDVGPEAVSRLRERRAAAPEATAVSRRSVVAEVFASAVGDAAQPFVADVARRDARDIADVVGAHAALLPKGPGLTALATAALQTVTPLTPFLRWDPVPSPAVVPLARYTEGESLRVLVVRSGVEQDPDTLALTVSDPATYAATMTAAHPELDLGYADRTERHLAPPKTSQIQAEQHGCFDPAIGSADPTEQVRMLGWALREDGSFLDLDRADIDNPPGRITQPGVALRSQPVTPQVALKALPLPTGEAPAPGQYVVHDTPELSLPYLPDPLADGVSLVFPEAGADRLIPFPFGAEGFTAAYGGQWPEILPFRLSVTGADELAARVDGRVLSMSLPAGDQQRFRLASSLAPRALNLLGAWRSLPPVVRADDDVAEAARDGWLWALTPSEDVIVVHAVPRPLEAPRPTRLAPVRVAGSTVAFLQGAVDVHGPSTDSLTAFASWVDQVDDLTLPAPEDRPTDGLAFTSPVKPYEDFALLSVADGEAVLPGYGPVAVHQALHQLGDTRHRVVEYQFRATTRFREYFHPALLTADPDVPRDDGTSVLGPKVRVSLPSTARPAAPEVHSVIPLFRWSDGTEPEQPMARRHTRRVGVRIYLQRSWYSSGNDELLGVLLAPNGNDAFGPPPADQSGFPFVSKWGQDPMWSSAQVTPRALPSVTLDNLLHLQGYDDHPAPGRPVVPPKDLPLTTLAESPVVTVVGYRPQFNRDRGLWYVDVALDPGSAFWPFLRLAVCRYQPESLPGCHLSAPVRCHFVQLPPVRTTSISRTDDRHVRVVVSGPIGFRGNLPREGTPLERLDAAVSVNRRVVASLQRRDPAIDSDLGWETVTAEPLRIRGLGLASAGQVAWVGELAADEVVALHRPELSGDSDWRVAVEEWELLPGDVPAPATADPHTLRLPVWERRLVYADHVSL